MRGRASLLALAAWVGLVGGAHLWGRWLLERARRLVLGTPPLAGRLDLRVGWGSLPAVGLGAAAILVGPRLAARLPWKRLLAAAFAAGAAWAAALALVDGRAGFVGPVLSKYEYLQDVALVGSPGEFLDSFTELIGDYRVHVRGHPPGMMLVLWGLDRLGLGGPWWAAAAEIAGWAAAIPAVLIGLKEVAGERPARAAAPFVAFAPAAIWVASSADALFAGVSAWGVALVVLATGRRDRRGDLLAAAGGVLLGCAAYLSYGLVLVGAVVAAVALARRRLRPLLMAAIGVNVVALAFTATGFYWWEGLALTRYYYLLGASRTRPYGYFLVANLAAFSLSLGPALAVALARLRGRGGWLLAAGGLAAVAVADLSGLSKGEVERIWLPFVPWVLTAASVLPAGPGTSTGAGWAGWLALNVAAGLVLQSVLRSPW